MTCVTCGHPNPERAKFCLECGASLQAPLAGDRRTSAPQAYTPKHLAEKILNDRAALEGERKQVTVLFADVRGSMELAEQLDPEEWHRIMDRFFALLAEGVHRFEGTVNQYTGDGIMALFGAPIAHEDHAQRACWAALHLRDQLRRFAQELRRERGLDFATRIGLNSGEVVVGRIGDDLRMDYTAQGHTVGLAQRMEALAEAGRIYLTAATAARVDGFFALEDLGEFHVKGASGPVRAYALEGPGRLRTRFDRARARGLSRFVGRDDEMRVLESALGRAERGEGQVLAIVAPAGTGKSRLCFELVERCRAKGVTVLEAQALPLGRTTPLRPVLDLLRQRFGITERDTDRGAREKIAGALLLLDPAFAEMLPEIFEFLGVPDPARPAPRIDPEAAQRRILAHLRRLVDADTRDRTVVMLIEDLHWLDPASDRFVAELIGVAARARSLVLLNFRPEYVAEWTSRAAVRRIALQPLGSRAVREMLAEIIGGDASVRGLADRIHAQTGGNPFFTEEIVQALIEDGSLTGTHGAYHLTRSLDRIPLPETVQSVLAARIDRLAPRDKRVLQTAAVIGREFAEPLLAAVCDVGGAELEAALAVLRRGEFLYETALYPEAEYAFKHPLTQEVAYRSQLGERRATVHRAVARALETRHAERLDEHAAEIAWHWAAGGEGAKAARWNGRAAEWAEHRDARAAIQHWQAAARLLPELPADRADADLLVHICQRLLFVGGWSHGQSEEESAAIRERGMRVAEHHGDIGAQVDLEFGYSNARLTRGHIAEFRALAHANARRAAGTGDEGLRALTRFEVATAEAFVGNIDASLRSIDEYLRSPGSRSDLTRHTSYDMQALAPAFRGWVLAAGGRMEAAESFACSQELSATANPITQVLSGMMTLNFGVRRGELFGAFELASRTLKVAEEFGAPNLRAAARVALADAFALRGQWREAAPLFEEAIALANEHHAFLEMEGYALARLAVAYVEIGEARRAKETAEHAIALMQRRGSKLQELENVVALARAEVALGHDDAVDPLLARSEALLAEIGALAFRPDLAEVRGERALRRGDEVGWRIALEEARRLFTETGAAGHAARVARALEAKSVERGRRAP